MLLGTTFASQLQLPLARDLLALSTMSSSLSRWQNHVTVDELLINSESGVITMPPQHTDVFLLFVLGASGAEELIWAFFVIRGC